ncbi:alpha/beta hydrolase, partial [Aeromonas salmonicida]
MKYTLMISLLAPTLLAGCELEKKEDPPFKGQHITAAYDTGVVCRQLQQEWQQDDIASQLSCHYLTVPLDYGVVAQISQQIMISPAPSDRYTRGFLTGRP